MNKLKKFKFLVPISIITTVVTIGYMVIYAHNPFSEMASVINSLLTGSIMERSAPEIIGIEQWLNTPNSQGLNIEELRGQVVLLDFWTYACINCQRSLPYVVNWDKQYRDQGLVVIGVHTPEFRFERNIDNVLAAIEEYGIEYPVAIDNDYKTWRAYHNHYWPAKYLISKSGDIVYMRFGEGAYEVTEAKIKELLAE